MAYSIPDCFMAAFVAGLVCGLLYEVLRIVRLVLRLKIVVFLCDVTFFVISAIIVFNLSMILGNYIRIYTILGYGAGVFVYITTFGRIMNGIESVAAICWRKTLGRLIHFIWKNLKAWLGSFNQYMRGRFGEINDFSVKTRQKLKKHLHYEPKMMYNKNNNLDTKGSENRNVIQAKIRRGS